MEAATASVHPGQPALYTITVSPEDAAVGDVTVQLALPAGQSTSGLPSPTWTVCGVPSGETCSLGAMHPGQSTELQAAVVVPSSSAAGGTVTLAATVTGAAVGATSTGSVNASATVSVVAAPSSTSPGSGGHHTTGSGHHSSGSGSPGTGTSTSGDTGGTSADTQPFDNLPPLNSSDGSSGSNGGNSSNLFPTITPSTPSTSGTTGGSHAKAAKPYKATTVADVLPLNTGQLSGQVAGLIVLGLGIILVFARISLRKPRSTEPKQ
jgi:hypothetical protein